MNILENKVLKVFLALLLTGYCFYQNFLITDISKRPSDGYDEQMWTGSSIASYHMFFKGHQRTNFYPERWFQGYSQKYRYRINELPAAQLQWFDDAMWTFGWKAPMVAKYIMGAGITWTSDTIIDPNGYFHQYSENKAENKWPGNYSPASFVEKARKTNALLNTLTIITMLVLGQYFFGFYSGFVGALLLGVNPVFTEINTAVGVDSAAAFFSLLSLVFLLLWIKAIYQNESTQKLYIYAGLLGLFFACAVGSKLSGAVVGYAIIILFVLMFYDLLVPNKIIEDQKRKKPIKTVRSLTFKKLIVSGSIIATVTFGLFIYSNPVLYDKPMLKVKMIRESVKEFFDIRAKSLQSEDINNSAATSFGLVIKRNFVKTEDTYYGTFGKLLPFKGNVLDLLCLGAGLYFLIYAARKQWKSKQRVSNEIALIVMFVVTFWGVVSFIWIDWARYHTPLMPTSTLIMGIGIVGLLKSVYKKLSKTAV